METTTYELVQGISHRGNGSMRIVDDEPSGSVLENRRRFFAANRIDPREVVTPLLVHGAAVHVARATDAGKRIPRVDGLVTNVPNLFLTVTVADCVPVFLFDSRRHAVGIAHAGWRGTVAGIVTSMVRTMEVVFGTDPTSLIAVTGPAIQACHFQIQPDLLPKFEAFPEAVIQREGEWFVDLPRIIRKQLTSMGMYDECIHLDRTCTVDATDQYFSYRRDKPEVIESMIAYIGLRAR